MAHVFFMQESKFKEAIRYYDPIVKKNSVSFSGILNHEFRLVVSVTKVILITSPTLMSPPTRPPT